MGKRQSGKGKGLRWPSWRTCLLVACAAVFLFSGVMALGEVLRQNRERQANQDLADQVHAIKAALAAEEAAQPAPQGSDTPDLPDLPDHKTDPKPRYDSGGILMQYSALHRQNPDLTGWLSIEGTQIDYPVMYAPDREDYYLRRGFDRKYAGSGSLYIAEACDPTSNHQLIYGHHMRNGTMFGTLTAYDDPDYAAAHPTIFFDTLTEERTYQVLAVFYSRVYTVDEEGVFRYYRYEDLTDPGRFAEYVEQVKAAALYDTGVEAEYGDSLLTLSTCSDLTDEGRFVLVAKQTD